MDPTAKWERIVAACNNGDMEEAAAAALDLGEWRRKGGFRPECVTVDVWAMGALKDFSRCCRSVAKSNERYGTQDL